MTDEVEDGGPAFPHSVTIGPSGDVYSSDDFACGMSLRDYFAARVMVEMIRLTMDADGGWDNGAVAAGCYRLADAMLAERTR